MAALTFPAASRAVAVIKRTPAAIAAAGWTAHSPVVPALALPNKAVPSNTETVLSASALPRKTAFVPASTPLVVITGTGGAVRSMVNPASLETALRVPAALVTVAVSR